MRALVCSVKIAGLEGENMQLLRFDEDGLIVDITVMLRPMRAGMALAEMGPRGEQRPDGTFVVKGLAPA